MFDYLLKNDYSHLIKVDFPFGRGSDKFIRFKEFKNGESVGQFRSKINFSTPDFLSYFKDLVYGIFYAARFLRGTDLFFGMDGLLVLVGLFFKRIGFIKKVSYVVVDYTPRRYKNAFFNKLYFSIDKTCLYGADYVLPLNKEMLYGRIRDKKLDEKKIHYVTTPFGNHSLKRKTDDYGGYTLDRIVYFGAISKNKGVELFVPIAKSLISKGFSDFTFEIIGGGDLDFLKNEIKNSNLERFFKVYGPIKGHHQAEEMLMRCGVALAPYFPGDKNNFSYYADPGKVKVYLGCGLPIVITDVPPLAKEIEKNKSGFISCYDPGDFADCIIRLIKNEQIYLQYRKNAIRFGKEFDWDIIFSNSFKELKF